MLTPLKSFHPDPEINQYYCFLEGSYNTEDFNKHMLWLMMRSPYVFGSYIELLQYLESEGRREEYKDLLQYALNNIGELIDNPELFERATRFWTVKEKEQITKLFTMAVLAEEVVYKKLFLKILARGFSKLLPRTDLISEAQLNNLVLIRKNIDIAPMQREVAQCEPGWLIDTQRQSRITVQRESQTIVLRALPHKSEQFMPVDGVHESERTALSVFFPRTLEFVEKFAQAQNGGLGRVALVRLKPWSKVYRHYDAEPYLRGRNRYHLVVKSKGGSYMESGIEKRVFKEGDLFFFDNKKMHTAVNESDDWRIHVIFDMKLPDNPPKGSAEEVGFEPTRGVNP